ncbi:MAG: hypothetical protein AAGI70_06685, partial [Pseudomonadota bacterium]
LVATLFGGATITMLDTLGTSNAGIELLRFADGDFTLTDIRAGLLAQEATANSDTIFGFGSADTFVNSAGDDVFVGLDGADTYTFGLGDGNDIIQDNGLGDDDVVEINVASTEASFRATGVTRTDLVVEFASSPDDSITIVNAILDSLADGIASLVFTDQTVTIAEARQTLLDGLATSGDEVIQGFASNDTLTGGAGDDVLLGGGGLDIYEFNIGDGNDIVDDRAGGGEVNLIGRNLDDATISRLHPTTNDVLFEFANGDSLIVLEGVGPASAIQAYSFEDILVFDFELETLL